MIVLKGRLPEKRGDAAGKARDRFGMYRTYPGFLAPSRHYFWQARCKSYLEQIRIRLQKNRVDLCIICIIMSNTNKDV